MTKDFMIIDDPAMPVNVNDLAAENPSDEGLQKLAKTMNEGSKLYESTIQPAVPDLTVEQMKAMVENDYKPSRKQRRAQGESVIIKRQYEGRCIHGSAVERDGVTYNRYLHVGKGWRERRV